MKNQNNSDFFEEKLQKEILQSEKIRAKLIGIAALILAFSITLLTTIYYNKFKLILKDEPYGIFFSIGVILLLAVREYNIYKFFKNRLTNNNPIKTIYRFINVFIETSVPTVIILVVSIMHSSSLLILSPLPYLYFIFIILSILNLDFKLSVFTGATAAIEYFLLVLYVLANFNSSNSFIHTDLYFYIGKSIIMLVSGGLAGFAANQLKDRIYKSYKLTNERNKIINMFGQQVSKEIVDELLLEKDISESQRKFVCIMFLDIRDFTPFSEKKEPEEIIKYQNDVFGFMIDIIVDNNGIINQFLGDGYMATFGAPLTKGNDCQNAVNAALQIINTLAKKNETGEIPFTQIGIGLHAGSVVTGNVGTSIRKQYSITGNTVILASRIEQLTKKFNSQLLVSEEVLNEITIEKTRKEFLGPVQIKGRETPINIYKLA